MKRATKKKLIRAANVLCFLILSAAVFALTVKGVYFYRSSEWASLRDDIVIPATLWGTGLVCLGLTIFFIVLTVGIMRRRKDAPRK